MAVQRVVDGLQALAVEAAEELVGRLPGEDDLEARLLHGAREAEQRRGGGAQQRLLGQLDRAREDLGDRGGVDDGAVEDRAELARDRVLRLALVVALVREADAEREQRVVAELARG